MTCVLAHLKGEFPFSEGYFLRLPAPLWLCVALCGATGHVRFLFLPALDEASMCIHLGRQAGTCPSIAHTHRQNRQCPEKKFDYACWKCPFCVDLASQKNSFVFIILHKWSTAFSAFDFGRSLAVFYIFGAAGAEITSSVAAG